MKGIDGSRPERYRSTPNKNEHSHVGDAAGYCLLGGGEHKDMITKKGGVAKLQQTVKCWISMFSPEELTQEMRLNWPEQKIVDWHPMHLQMIELNQFDAQNEQLFENYTNICQVLLQKVTAYTQCKKNICHVWYMELWDGVYEAWLIPSNDISRKAFRMHRASKLFFEYAANKLEMKRLQITVCSRNIPAYKWAKVCYFENEVYYESMGLKEMIII